MHFARAGEYPQAAADPCRRVQYQPGAAEHVGRGDAASAEKRRWKSSLRLFLLITYRHWLDRAVESRTALVLPSPSVCRSVRPRCRSFWNLAPCTTGCLEQHLLTIGISILGVQS